MYDEHFIIFELKEGLERQIEINQQLTEEIKRLRAKQEKLREENTSDKTRQGSRRLTADRG